MKKQVWYRACALMIGYILLAPMPAVAQYGVEVVSYDAGSMPAAGFTDSSAALGSPVRFTGEGVFPGAVTPFNPPFLNSEIVSVGEGGQLTLRLSNYAIPQADGPEIGVFTNAGVVLDFVNGVAATPAEAFGVDAAVVEVSDDGSQWLSLGETVFNLPTNGYTDLSDPFSAAPGSMLSDFQQPFTRPLSDFAGLPYSDAGNPDALDLLAGSGGGTWLDVSGTGLTQVGYIRFSVADDGNPSPPGLNFELDAVSVAHAAMGAQTLPEPATVMLCGLVPLWAASLFGRSARRKE